MRSVSLPLAVGVLAALIALSAISVRWMLRAGPIDVPDIDGGRKQHAAPTPKGGGLGVVGAVVIGMPLLLALSDANGAEWLQAGIILGAALVLAAISFIDDLHDLSPWTKLAAQVGCAVACAIGGGYLRQIVLPGIGVATLGWFGTVLAIIWILLVTNALNFIDGMNGLAAGSAAIASAFLIAYAWIGGDILLSAAALPLLAGLLGFLPFNYPAGRIFMGDVGSQFIGFVFAALLLQASKYAAPVPSMSSEILLIAAILLDVLVTLVRRARRGERLSAPHRDHFYQLAERSGMDRRAITLVYWGFAVLGGLAGLLMLRADPAQRPFLALIALLPILAWMIAIGMRYRRHEAALGSSSSTRP